MKARAAPVVIIGIVAVALQPGDADAHSNTIWSKTSVLADGVRVFPGSTPVGAVFPSAPARNRSLDKERGWTALLRITGSAGSVYDGYVAQLRARDRAGKAKIQTGAGDYGSYTVLGRPGKAVLVLLTECPGQ